MTRHRMEKSVECKSKNKGGIPMQTLKKKKLFLLDMDGTLYLDQELFDGTIDFLNHVKSIGGRYLFLTNNSSKSVDKYIEKLAGLGISSVADDFLTSTDATILYLKQQQYKKIYAFGTTSFKKQLADSDLRITDRLEDDVDCLCISNDTELTFQKLEDACILLNRGVDYIATNPDWVCPTWYGSVPDCGSFAQILCTATKRMPKFIGKPEPTMALLAIEKTGFAPEEAVLIGDRVYTDIACAVNAGISSIFVLSGEGTLEDVENGDVKPEYIYENIRTLYHDLTR